MAVPIPGGQGINNLTTLIKRLEAATSRLEDIALQSFDNGASQALSTTRATNASSSAPDISALPSQSIREPPVPIPAEPLPPAISDMDELIRNGVQSFIDASKGIDPLVEEQVAAVAKGFADQRKFLIVTTKAKRPDPQSQSFMDLLKDLQQDLGSAGDIKDSNRGSAMKEHLSMVAEGINTLQWLVMDGKPADLVAEMIGGAQMYGNRILKTYKDGDQSHVKFVRAFIGLLQALKDYITKHYRTGVTWNANGIDAAEAMQEVDSVPSSVVAPPPPSSVGPPPPPPPPLPTFDQGPPPPPPPPPAPNGASSSGGAGDMGAVFEQLNKGEAVTAGLKKVDKSQMTHKNPSLRASSAVPGQQAGDISRSRSPGPEIKPKPHNMRQGSGASAKKEGKRELDGNKWLIENWDTPSKPMTIEVSMTQSVLISRCKNTTVILRGKANAISVDNSPRTQLLLENLVSSIDVIKSPNFAVQITGSLPTIMLDQVDGASIYLSEESLGTEVFTSKCSSINIVMPPEREEDDSRECPLPEQIRTVIKDRQVVHEIVEHAG